MSFADQGSAHFTRQHHIGCISYRNPAFTDKPGDLFDRNFSSIGQLLNIGPPILAQIFYTDLILVLKLFNTGLAKLHKIFDI
ncbi:hypothetical protein D3C75_886390 [compost metagenome]